MEGIRKAVVTGLLCGLVVVGSGRGAVAAGAASGALETRVNLNSASADELARLPGVGPAKAKAIIEHRNEEPFRTPEELRKVKGIGEKLYDRLKDQITVEPSAPTRGHGG